MMEPRRRRRRRTRPPVRPDVVTRIRLRRVERRRTGRCLQSSRSQSTDGSAALLLRLSQLSAQLSPTTTKGAANGSNGASGSIGLQSVSNVASAEAEDDPDFADWDAAESGSSVAVNTQSPSTMTAPLSSGGRYSSRPAAPEPEATPPPPPEPDYFAGMGMQAVDSSGVQVTRVAAKKPLPSALAAAAASSSALHNPANNLYADVAVSAASNAHSTRFLDDLVDESSGAAVAGWGADDDLGSLGLDSPVAGAAAGARTPGGRKKGAGAQAPREKKPRGIGAVAVALDAE